MRIYPSENYTRRTQRLETVFYDTMTSLLPASIAALGGGPMAFSARR